MTTYIDDIVDLDEYRSMLQQKYIKEQSHPKFPHIVVCNYTDSCVWEGVWNKTTLQCRGLIYNTVTGEVLARPFTKFFNIEQPEAPKWGEDELVEVTDKLDGSLGILFWNPAGEPEIATRGSFTSDQAQWGTEVYQGKFDGTWEPDKNNTYLFELIYPENRIVVDYEGMQDMVFLAAIDKKTGKTLPIKDAYGDWGGPIRPTLEDGITYKEALALPEREGLEGYVIFNPAREEYVKLKFSAYKELHRILTNTSTKNIWEVLSTNQNPEEVFASAPDEFHVWMKSVISDLTAQFDDIKTKAYEAYGDIVDELGKEYTRKDFAEKANQTKYSKYLFLIFDGHNIDEQVWRSIKPVGGVTYRIIDSDSN